MKYLLDTNAVSALMKGDPAVVEHLRRIDKQNVAIPQPVLAEIAFGIARLPQSKRKNVLKHRYEAIRAELARVPWSDDVSDQFGIIKANLERRGERIEDFDVAIGAHAVATDAILVTHNIGHLSRITSLKVDDWQGAGDAPDG